MIILSEQLKFDLANGKPIALDLGCGKSKKEGYYGVDIANIGEVDIIADLEKPLIGLEDGSVSSVFSYHCLEHIYNLSQLMHELHRVLVPSGTLEFYVPHFSNPYYYSDPTHVRSFGLYSMDYFSPIRAEEMRGVPVYWPEIPFRVDSVWIKLFERKWVDKLFFPGMTTIINSSRKWQDRYERRLCRFFPADTICFKMTVMKIL